MTSLRGADSLDSVVMLSTHFASTGDGCCLHPAYGQHPYIAAQLTVTWSGRVAKFAFAQLF